MWVHVEVLLSLELPHGRYPTVSLTRLLWLVRLRWYALAGVSLATVVAALGLNPGINLPILAGALLGGVLFNLYFWRRVYSVRVTRRHALQQVLVDIGALTLVLWAGGGAQVPFKSFYFFHIIIGGILVGPRAAAIAAMAALLGDMFLEVTELVPVLAIASWQLPDPGWARAADGLAFVLTVSFIAYFVTHIMGELQERHHELVAERKRATSALARLTFTLDHIDAGMEVVDVTGMRTWSNQTFQRLFPNLAEGAAWTCPGGQCREVGKVCPALETLHSDVTHRCQVAVGEGEPDIYEIISCPLRGEGGPPQVMNLYLNHTRELTLQRQVEQAARLSAFGRLAQGMAHELNTPLGTIHALTQDVREVLTDLQLKADAGGRGQEANTLTDPLESCDLILDEARRCRKITTALLAGKDLYAEESSTLVELHMLVEHACVKAFSGDEIRPQVTIGVAPGLRVETDPDRMTQVLLNVLRNARDAAGEGGHIEVSGERIGEGVEIRIRDDGPGISRAVEGRLFEPFFTTKDPGKGTGLGLYTSWLIMQRLGG